MKIEIRKVKSEKSGKTFIGAGVDLGYKFMYLCFGDYACSELAGMSVAQLHRELDENHSIIL